METLEQAIWRLAPNFELIHECLGMGYFVELVVTSDGYFLGRAQGDCGFNHFLGTPSPKAVARTRAIFLRLTASHRQELIRRLHERGIPPPALGIPEPNN